MAMNAAGNRRSGFTLLEILVTVSIITMLVAILVPAVMQARAMSRRTVCQSNLRQWALGIQMYADAHHGLLPFRGQGVQPTTQLDGMDDWMNALPPYVESAPYIDLVNARKKPNAGDSSIWVCPDAVSIAELRAEELYPAVANQIDPTTFFSYGMNMALSTPYMGRPDRIDRIGPLQLMVFMADSLGPSCSTIPHKYFYSPTARHIGNTVNIAFMDGRVESYVGDEVGCRVGDPKRPDIVWYPPNCKWPGPPR
jgi:prepilin-type N-terminal cleavage/methylation domain-containing protein/prepilin-type processing-associated H-X9-DG protein